MSSLFSTLRASSGTLQSYERALQTTQNNIGNASTPDYASQQVQFNSFAFQPDAGLAGGNVTATTKDTRDAFADRSLRQEISNLGATGQQVSSLTLLQNNFDVTGQTGISGGLNKFFSSFSALSASPTDKTSRQGVINAAQQLAQSFQQTATSLANSAAGLQQQIQTKVETVNSLAGQIQGYNQQRIREGGPDANLDAKVQTALESLSEIVNVTSTVAPDGTTSVLIAGQTPLVLGTQIYQIQSGPVPLSTPPPTYPGGTPAEQIRDSNGNDVTAQVTQGELGGLLQVRNGTIPSLIGDTTQTGSLNQLARSFAERVNSLLTGGQISAGPPVQPGVALFSYDTTDPTKAATSLTVNGAIDSSQIATIDPGPPTVGNGIASKLAALAQGTHSADQVNGVSFTAFFGQVAASVGSQLSVATNSNDVYSQSVTQVRNLRDQVSGVSLDTEAVNLIQFQKAYDATAKLIGVLNDITQSTLDILK